MAGKSNTIKKDILPIMPPEAERALVKDEASRAARVAKIAKEVASGTYKKHKDTKALAKSILRKP